MKAAKQFEETEEFLRAALAGYQQRRDVVSQKIDEIMQRLGVLRRVTVGGASPDHAEIVIDGGGKLGRKKRRLSAAARKRISAAQKKRWADHRSRKAKAKK